MRTWAGRRRARATPTRCVRVNRTVLWLRVSRPLIRWRYSEHHPSGTGVWGNLAHGHHVRAALSQLASRLPGNFTAMVDVNLQDVRHPPRPPLLSSTRPKRICSVPIYSWLTSWASPGWPRHDFSGRDLETGFETAVVAPCRTRATTRPLLLPALGPAPFSIGPRRCINGPPVEPPVKPNRGDCIPSIAIKNARQTTPASRQTPASIPPNTFITTFFWARRPSNFSARKRSVPSPTVDPACPCS